MPTSIADGNLPFSESHVLPEHCGDDDVAPATLDDEHDDPAITTPTASRPFSRVAANSSGDEGTHPPPFREPERWQSIPDTADDSAGMPSSSRDSMDQAHAFGAAHEPILVRSGPTAMDPCIVPPPLIDPHTRFGEQRKLMPKPEQRADRVAQRTTSLAARRDPTGSSDKTLPRSQFRQRIRRTPNTSHPRSMDTRAEAEVMSQHFSDFDSDPGGEEAMTVHKRRKRNAGLSSSPPSDRSLARIPGPHQRNMDVFRAAIFSGYRSRRHARDSIDSSPSRSQHSSGSNVSRGQPITEVQDRNLRRRDAAAPSPELSPPLRATSSSAHSSTDSHRQSSSRRSATSGSLSLPVSLAESQARPQTHVYPPTPSTAFPASRRLPPLDQSKPQSCRNNARLTGRQQAPESDTTPTIGIQSGPLENQHRQLPPPPYLLPSQPSYSPPRSVPDTVGRPWSAIEESPEEPSRVSPIHPRYDPYYYLSPRDSRATSSSASPQQERRPRFPLRPEDISGRSLGDERERRGGQ